MKKIENKKVFEKEKYVDLLDTCNKQLPEGWFSVDEMRKRLKISDILEDKEKKAYEFEDADFDTLKSLVNGMKWGILNKEVLDFVDYINSIK